AEYGPEKSGGEGRREVGHLQAEADPRREKVRRYLEGRGLRQRLDIRTRRGPEGDTRLRGGDEGHLSRRLRRRWGVQSGVKDEEWRDRGEALGVRGTLTDSEDRGGGD